MYWIYGENVIDIYGGKSDKIVILSFDIIAN